LYFYISAQINGQNYYYSYPAINGKLLTYIPGRIMSEKDVIVSPILSYFENLNYSSEFTNSGKIIRKYSSISEELNSLYAGVGLRDISTKGIIELRGADVLDYLHRISTNHLKELPREKLIQTIFTTEKGRIIDVCTLLNFDDYKLLICNAEYRVMVKRWIDKYTISDDVKATDTAGKYVLLELWGKQANSFMMFICGSIVNNIGPNSFKVINAENMLFFLARITERNGAEKFWIIADPENGRKLIQYMQENQGPFDFSLVGEDAFNIYRVEQGLAAAPYELNDTINPHEVKMLDLIDFKKGCYIGQEVIARLDTYEKVKSYLLGVKFEERLSDQSGEILLFDGDGIEAGKVTSVVYSEKCKKDIGLAYIKKAYAEEGKQLYAKSGDGKSVLATICNLPFKK
jgi:tRNA-modifying protein YgfZ